MNTMPLWQQAALIAICAFGTILTRFLPFLIFQKAEELPAYIQYLGKALPTAVFALLVVFCLRNVSFTTGNCGLPEIISLLVTSTVHVWRRQMLLSMFFGTACYMFLMQYIFI